MNYTTLEKLKKNFWSKVNKTDTCWLWTGQVSSNYPYISQRGKTRRAHIVSWEWANNREVRQGYHIHHLCKNRICVRPDHLEELSADDHWEATLRSIREKKESRIHCKCGHLLTEDTSYLYTNPTTGYSSRRCRICARTNAAKQRIKNGNN